LNGLAQIQERLQPYKAALVNHPVYGEVDRLEALRAFMSHHVFAVWDFMSLLKALQRRLTCVDVPWLPAHNSANARLINEIVLAEESDADGRGGFASHFELYLRAMERCGANTTPIDRLLAELRRGRPLAEALQHPDIPAAAGRFVRQTFDIIERGDVCALAAAFTFGREDLLPAVFQRIVDELNAQAGGNLDDFHYYLQRHIGLDAGEHGPMASRLVQSLCGADESRWRLAEQTAISCLQARQTFWDEIHLAIRALGPV